MSAKIFESIVSELIYVIRIHEIERLKQDAGPRLYSLFKSHLLESYPFLISSEGRLVEVFYLGSKNILSIEKQKDAIKITLNAKYGNIKDDKGLFRDVSKVGHWGYGDYQVKLLNTNDMSYVIRTINQLI